MSMTIHEIPAAEQLMGMTTEPQVQPAMQFLVKGLIWPTPEAIERQMIETQASAPYLNDTLGWIALVLKPEFIAADLRSRLLGARAIVSGQDAFLARYRVDHTSIQIAVTRFRVHLVIAPEDTSPLAAMHHYLQLDQAGEEYRFDVPWQTGQFNDLRYGYQPRGSASDWRESIYYLTNAEAIKLSVKKIPNRSGGTGKVKSIVAPTEEAESHWFPAKP
jgi:hypothetical protein